MKKMSRAILLATLGLAFVPVAKASSGFDLVLGFTQNGGNTGGMDYLLDIGPVIPYSGATALYNGEQWNVSAALTGLNMNLTSVQWGVVGDAITSDGQSPQTLWVTTSGGTPPPIGNDSRFGSVDTSINAIEQGDFGGGAPGYQSFQGQSAIVSAGYGNSWSQQTASGTLGTQFLNVYGNPNVTGETSDTLWQVAEGGSAIDLGTLSLNSSGIVTFTAVPEPGTLGLLSVAGLLALAWRNRFNSGKA